LINKLNGEVIMRDFDEYLMELKKTELGRTPISVSLAQAGIELDPEILQDWPTAVKLYPWIDDLVRELIDVASEAGGLGRMRRVQRRMGTYLPKPEREVGDRGGTLDDILAGGE